MSKKINVKCIKWFAVYCKKRCFYVIYDLDVNKF